jgi:hypothetical protein
MRSKRSRAAALATLAAAWLAPAAAAAADPEIQEMKREVEELRRRDAEREAELERLERRLEEAEGRSEPAAEPAEPGAEPEPPPPPEPEAERRPWIKRPSWQDPAPDLWSTPIGDARLRLIDLSLDVLAAAGSSTASEDELELLEAGGHDPHNRGFTLQQVELGFQGAVDPYLRADAYLVYFLDAEGESQFELEEAFFTTLYLPFGVSDAGFQLEGGTFFTDFGRLNAQHPHFWHWQDQPFVWSRFFGGDGMRGPGVKLSWLTPLPWYSDLSVTWQNAKGETQTSFFANDEVFSERPIGGRPFVDDTVSTLTDFVYTVRSANGFDLTSAWSAQVGASGSFGPNPTGSSARTYLWGLDAVLKWRPEQNDRGWPFVILQAEYAQRIYEAQALFDVLVDDAGNATSYMLPRTWLHDQGFYAYALYGFVRRWAGGVRLEWGNGSGDSVMGDVPISVSDDPFRAQRWRVSPLLIFHPSEYVRLRLQYNYDRTNTIRDNAAHSVWLGIEFGIGAHPAHAY